VGLEFHSWVCVGWVPWKPRFPSGPSDLTDNLKLGHGSQTSKGNSQIGSRLQQQARETMYMQVGTEMVLRRQWIDFIDCVTIDPEGIRSPF
jgi:hypothetical protein